MGEFFKPWRRKLGVLTLLMACAFAGEWIRSLSLNDELHFPSEGSSRRFLLSKNGVLQLRDGVGYANHIRPLRWHSRRVNLYPPETFEGLKCLREGELCGLKFQEYVDDDLTGGFNKEYRLRIYSVNYVSLVIPLTLLSGWLLLSKRREPKSVTSTEQV